MSDLSEDLKKAIEASLPGMVSKELRAYLDEAEENKAALILAHKEFDTIKKLNDSQAERIRQLEALERKHEDLLQREENLAEEKRTMRVTLAEKDAVSATALAKQAFEMVGMVFRNTEVRKHVYDSNSTNNFTPPSQANNWVGQNETRNTTKNFTETKETK